MRTALKRTRPIGDRIFIGLCAKTTSPRRRVRASISVRRRRRPTAAFHQVKVHYFWICLLYFDETNVRLRTGGGERTIKIIKIQHFLYKRRIMKNTPF